MSGTVTGTAGSDLLDESYTGDPQGDRVDSGDAILPGAGPEDDLILGLDGDDLINAGAGNDVAFGGDGNDVVFGNIGDDTLYGDSGNDLVKGGDGTDVSFGGTGNDTFTQDPGTNDQQFGGDDRDLFFAGDDGDLMDGGAGGDDFDTLDLRGVTDYRIENLVPDSNGNGFNGTVVYLDADGNPTGETFDFVEIEQILEDDPAALDGTVEGTDGDDVIDSGYTGDPEGDRVDNDDAIFPGAGPDDDLIEAYGGNDSVTAGEGNDVVFGGTGNDVVDGGAGNDTLNGEDGNDSLLGGTGNDVVFGGIGNDVIDTSDGGTGLFDNPYPPLPVDGDQTNDIDTVFGGAGDDTIRTGDDRDFIDGGSGNDRLDGGIDDDSIRGGLGDDTIFGGEGNDSISGNAGNDLIYGGLDPSFPDDLNIPDETDLVPDNGQDRINAGAGDDTVFGMDDDDVIIGGDGNDRLIGGIDDDTLYGEADRDTFVYEAGDGSDRVYGGAEGDDFDVLDLSTLALGSFRIVGVTTDSDGNGIDGTVQLLDADGTVTDTIRFENIEQIVPCFTPGTLIATPRGEKPAEDLQVGDRVITRDNGIQEIRWVGHKAVTGRELTAAPHLRPVLVKAGSLGNGLPERDMMLSPNHRVLVANERTQLYFEENEVLAAVKHLAGTPGVVDVAVSSVTYIHFMFDRHEVVLSNGAWTESFQPGDMSLKGIGNAQRTEIFELFPDLATKDGVDGYHAARKTLKKHEARLLVR
jgi:Ca2+-binding RTX toxin-like protein